MKCKYEGDGAWSGKCIGTREVDPCCGYYNCKAFRPVDESNEDLYKRLGFVQPAILENRHGIKIYTGTKGKEDWCVEIPKKLCEAKYSKYNYDGPYMVYLVSETEALRIAGEFTNIAKRTGKLY